MTLSIGWFFSLLFLIMGLFLVVKMVELAKKNNHLYILSLFITIFVIVTIMAPFFIGYSTVEENGIIVIYTNYTYTNYTYTNKNFVQQICKLWNTYANINKISISKPIVCPSTDNYQSLSDGIYLFIICEFIIFFVFILLLSNIIKDFHNSIVFLVSIFLFFWLCGITVDTFRYGNYQESNYVRLNYQYDISGYTSGGNNLYDGFHKRNFTNIYTLSSNLCDLDKYFSTEKYLFLHIDRCDVYNGLGLPNIIGTIIKIIALGFLSMANVFHALFYYARNKYNTLNIN